MSKEAMDSPVDRKSLRKPASTLYAIDEDFYPGEARNSTSLCRSIIAISSFSFRHMEGRRKNVCSAQYLPA